MIIIMLIDKPHAVNCYLIHYLFENITEYDQILSIIQEIYTTCWVKHSKLCKTNGI